MQPKMGKMDIGYQVAVATSESATHASANGRNVAPTVKFSNDTERLQHINSICKALVGAQMKRVIDLLLESKYGIKDKTELLQLVRKYPEGLAVIDLKDAYPTVMEDLQTLAACLGAFEEPNIIHVDDIVDPVRDLEVITKELRLKPSSLCISFQDIQFMERKIQDIEKSMKRSNDK
ncbi:hypothetical protein JHK85_013164 [Glycine max]|nr:hypothetical protein JHK85_013164 [Glycine max]KAG5057826.1 hypothetical protein JHK86_012822 [Glycine max]